MADVVVLDLADQDLAGIQADLFRNAGVLVAANYDALFFQLFQKLAEFPEMCQSRPKLGSDIRVGVVRPFLVIYRYTAATQTVAILRVLHARRKVTRKALG